MPELDPIGVDPVPVAEVVDVPKLDTETAAKLEAMGVAVGQVTGKDQSVTLPVGWDLTATALVDDAGAERAVLTPLVWNQPGDKVLSLRPRYSVRFVAESATAAHMAVVDAVDGSTVTVGGSYTRFDPTQRVLDQLSVIASETASQEACRTYLTKNLAQWKDPAAYWPAPK